MAKIKRTKTAAKPAKPVSKPAKPASKPANPVSKGSKQVKQPVKKVRGTALTVVLVLILLHGIVASYLAFITRKEVYANALSWVLPALTLVSLATVIGAIGMFLWKKWGIYVYAAACVVSAAVHLVLTGSGLVVLYDLIPLAFLGYVINLQSKAHLFE